MSRALALCLVALPIAGCASLDGISYSKARTAVGRAEDAYDRVHAIAIEALPYLPQPVADRARADLASADVAIAVIRRDATAAERLDALRDLAISVTKIVSAVRAR